MKRIVIAVLLLAALALPAQAQPAAFPDIPAGHWAAEAVAEITRLGIITGFPDGSFRGNDNLTRYQAALIIQRVLSVVGTGAPAVDLSSLRNAIQELSADLSALNVRVTQIEMDRGAVEQLRQTVAALQAAQADFVTRPEFTELKNAVAALTGQVSQEDLARLQQAIEALRAGGVSPGDIAALSQAVAQLQQTAVTADDLARVQDIAVEARATALQALAAVEALRTRPADPGMDAAALSDLSARVEANSVAIETALARTRSLAAAIDELRAQIGLEPVDLEGVDPAVMEAQFLSLRAQLEATQQDVIGVSNLIVTLNNESIGQGNRLTDLEGRVSALEQRAMVSPDMPATPDAPEAVGALEDQVAAIRDFVILVRRDVVGLSDRVAGIESVVASSAEEIAAIQERLAKLEAAGDLGGLQNRVATLEGQVLKLSGSIAVSLRQTRTYASPAFDLTRFDIDRLNVDGNVQSAFSAGDLDGDGSFIDDFDNWDESRARAVLTLSASFAKQGRSSGGLNVHDISVVFNAVSYTHAGDPTVGPGTVYPAGNITGVLWTINRFTATFTINGQPFQVVFGVQPSVKFTEYVFDNDTPTASTRGLRGWRGQGGEGIRFSAPAIDLGLPVTPGFTFFLGKASANNVADVPGAVSTGAAPWIVMGLRPTLNLFDLITVGFSWVDVYEDHLYGNSAAPIAGANPYYHKVAGADAMIDLDILEIKGEFAEAWGGEYINQTTKDPLPISFLGNLAYVTVKADIGFVVVNANYRWLTPFYDGVSGDLGGSLNYGNNTFNAAPFRLNQYGFGANATVTLGDDFLKVVGGYDQATEFDGTVNGRGHFKFDASTPNALTRTAFGAQATVRLAAIVLTAHVVSDAEAVGAADFGTDFQIRASVGHDGKQANPFIPGLTINAHYQSDGWTGSVWTTPFGRSDIGVSASFEVSLLGGTITPRASYATTSYGKDAGGDQVASGDPAITLGAGNRTLNPLLGFTATIDPRMNPANATFGTDSTTLNFGATVKMPLPFLPWNTSVALSGDYFSRNLRAIGAALVMADGQDQAELRFLLGLDFGDFLFANSKLAVRAGWIDIGNTQVGAGPAALGETRYGYWLTWTYWDVSVSYGAFSFMGKGTDPTPVDDIWTWYDGWRISYTVNF
jgi:hypothetical protein